MELDEKLNHVLKQQEKIMATISDVTTAVAALSAAVDVLLAKPAPDNSAALQSVVDGLNAITAKINAALTPPA